MVRRNTARGKCAYRLRPADKRHTIHTVTTRNASPFLVAAVQHAPVFLDRDATIDKASGLIREAASRGAKLVVFPEGFVPGYPLWVWQIAAGATKELRALYTGLLDQSVSIPSPATDRLQSVARETGVTVAIGINERNDEASGSSLFNSLLWIGDDGSILGRHRKLVPTAGERLIHAQGDGSTLGVRNRDGSSFRTHLLGELHAARALRVVRARSPDSRGAHVGSRRAMAFDVAAHRQGRPHVRDRLLQRDAPRAAQADVPYAGTGEWVNPGDSVIVDPDGKIVAGPMREEQGILYGEIAPANFAGPRWQLDVAAHYARPDVCSLTIHESPRPVLTSAPVTSTLIGQK